MCKNSVQVMPNPIISSLKNRKIGGSGRNKKSPFCKGLFPDSLFMEIILRLKFV